MIIIACVIWAAIAGWNRSSWRSIAAIAATVSAYNVLRFVAAARWRAEIGLSQQSAPHALVETLGFVVVVLAFYVLAAGANALYRKWRSPA